MERRALTRYISYDGDCSEAEWERDYREFEEISLRRKEEEKPQVTVEPQPAPLPLEQTWILTPSLPSSEE